MKWKIIGWTVIALFVVLSGVFIYETITDYLFRADVDAVTTQWESDYNRVLGQLNQSRERVVVLEATVAELGIRNNSLEEELGRSTGLAGDLADENKRLSGILSEGYSGTETLNELNNNIGDSISRAQDLLRGIIAGNRTD